MERMNGFIPYLRSSWWQKNVQSWNTYMGIWYRLTRKHLHKYMSSLLNQKCNWSFIKSPVVFTNMMTRNLETSENLMIRFWRNISPNKILFLQKSICKFPRYAVSWKSDHKILWCFQIPRHHAGEKRRRFFEGSITFMVQQRWQSF